MDERVALLVPDRAIGRRRRHLRQSFANGGGVKIGLTSFNAAPHLNTRRKVSFDERISRAGLAADLETLTGYDG